MIKTTALFFLFVFLFVGSLIAGQVFAADTVPTDVQLPGTQPLEISNLESPNKCDNCHGGYNSSVEPAHNWRGSMMSHAGRDPIFWATLAVAEQDFNGVGDLCIRCHSTGGWLAGRSTPTDGSGLAAGDSDGVECDFCHKMTNPDDSEHIGEMFPPFDANDAVDGYYGSGMASMWGGSDKLGPYNDADARHQFMQSLFHRDVDFCGTCHDVSNSVTGDLAPGHGALPGAPAVVADGNPGAPVDGKAAFNNPPYAYGIVERTFSEYKSGQISKTLVDKYDTLPTDIKGGALEAVYLAATQGGTASANYRNPAADRYFSCQTCHMRAVTGKGANKRGVATRVDLPLHDMTGGNYWMASAIDWLDQQGKLRLGGGMTDGQVLAMYDGALRAREQLDLAATLDVVGDTVRVINHTGHKLISGYPEGRRMWLNVKWYDAEGTMVREDGKYDVLPGVTANGLPVKSILELEGENTHIWENHMGMTQEWANTLVGLGYERSLALSYDRESGAVEHTLGQLANSPPGTEFETFHFALNNTVIKDNRIPPYGMGYDEAKERNASPVPADQYGGAPGGTYLYYDSVSLNPPTDVVAVSAEIKLLYQPTSWEYIQFLSQANDGSNSFLADEGTNILDAWLNTGMAAPYTMASASWGSPQGSCDAVPPVLTTALADDKKVTLAWSGVAGISDYGVYYDQSGKAQEIAGQSCDSAECSYIDLNLTNGQEYCYKLTSRESADCESDFSNTLCATPLPPGQQALAAVTGLASGGLVKDGKGKNAPITFSLASVFTQGDTIAFEAQVLDGTGTPLSGARFDININGPELLTVTSESTGSDGYALASWATQSPNRKGNGGTSPGDYTATVSGLSVGGFEWDGEISSISFTIE